MHWNCTYSSGYWFMDQNLENIDFDTFFTYNHNIPNIGQKVKSHNDDFCFVFVLLESVQKWQNKEID